jgi:hypothetical protein
MYAMICGGNLWELRQGIKGRESNNMVRSGKRNGTGRTFFLGNTQSAWRAPSLSLPRLG